MSEKNPRFVYFERPNVGEAVIELNEEYREYHIVPGSLSLNQHPIKKFSCLLEHDIEGLQMVDVLNLYEAVQELK